MLARIAYRAHLTPVCCVRPQCKRGLITTASAAAVARPPVSARPPTPPLAANGDRLTVTVCGGGNAAHVAAGMFAHQGANVHMFFSFEDEAKRFRAGCGDNDGVTVITKTEEYKGKPQLMTSNPRDAMRDADIVLMLTPALAHEPILRHLANYLEDGTYLGAIPAPGAFDLLAKHTLGDTLKEKNITLFGGSSLPWACRIMEYGARVQLLGEKRQVPLSCLPQTQESYKHVRETLNSVHRNTTFAVAGHFLNITLWCTNAIIHPGIMYGLWHDWDGNSLKEPPLFYQGCTAFTAHVLQSLSDEVQACRDAIAARTDADMATWQPLSEYLISAYGHAIADKSSLAQVLATNDAFRGLTAPCKKLEDGSYVPNFRTRYLTEDLPHGIAVLRGIAEICGVETPMMDTVITWAQNKIGHEYLVDGELKGKNVSNSGCPQRFGIHTLQQLVAASV